MARREVTHTRKNTDGDILALCNRGEFWSPRQKSAAIRDIENGRHSYCVSDGFHQVDIHIANGPGGKYLRTDPDATTSNNLDDLPDC